MLDALRTDERCPCNWKKGEALTAAVEFERDEDSHTRGRERRQSSSAIMAMNNIYCRFLDLTENPKYLPIPRAPQLGFNLNLAGHVHPASARNVIVPICNKSETALRYLAACGNRDCRWRSDSRPSFHRY